MMMQGRRCCAMVKVHTVQGQPSGTKSTFWSGPKNEQNMKIIPILQQAHGEKDVCGAHLLRKIIQT